MLRLQRREVVLATGSVLACFTFFYIVSAYLAAYAHTDLGYSRNAVLFVGVLGGLAGIAFTVFSAIRCVQVGHRRVMMVGWAACLPWSFVLIPLINTGNLIFYAVAIVGMKAFASVAYGPTAAFLPELFATRYRYSGSALAMNLAGVAGGAVPPLIAGTLQATYGGWAIGLMLAAVASVSLVCTHLLPETKGSALQPIRGADDASVAS